MNCYFFLFPQNILKGNILKCHYYAYEKYNNIFFELLISSNKKCKMNKRRKMIE